MDVAIAEAVPSHDAAAETWHNVLHGALAPRFKPRIWRPASEDTITVLLCFDSNYAQHAAACIASILAHSERQFEFVIASTHDPSTFAGRIRRSFQDNARATIRILQAEVPPHSEFPVINNLSSDCYLRLWANDLLPDHSRVIYLDPDIVAVRAIDPLWTVDLQGHALAAVPIPNSVRPTQFDLPAGTPWFNSGVMVMDLDRWRERSYPERCVERVAANAHRLQDGDQDGLNLATAGDWLPLDFTWNVINPFFRPSYDTGLPASEIARIRAEARLIHFNGWAKPWVYMDNHPMRHVYLQNLRRTDWRDWQPPDFTPANSLKKILSRALPTRMKQAARRLKTSGPLARPKIVASSE